MSYERKVLVHHSLASIVALGITGLARLLYSVIIARRFGVETLGLANALISQAFFLAIPLSFFAVAVSKYSAEFLGRNSGESIRAITLPAFLLPFAGLILLPFNVYIAMLAVFRGVQLTLRGFLYGIHRGEHYAYIISLAFLGFLVGFLLPNALAPYILFLGIISALAWAYLLRFRLISRPRGKELRLITSYSTFAFLGTLSGVFLIQGPYFMSERLSNAEVAGMVSAVLSTVFLLTYLPQVLQSAIMPLFSYKHGKNEREYIRRLADESTLFLILVTSATVFVLMLFGRELLSLVFDFRIGPSLYIALMAVEVYIAYNPSIVALNSTSYVKHATAVSLAGASVALISWFLLIPAFGDVGVMIGLFLAYASILVGVAWLSNRLLQVSPRVYEPLAVSLLLQVAVFVSKSVLLAGFIVFLVYERKNLLRIISSLGT
ncbi:MATE family efflux transporter [Thermococcus sp.]|uniref:lipopolysaccharide biosynthesis protein n=1 Tax=Thermococcus sp. TaxID=35749 RepID=UPI00261B64E6|nr:MATE family efflux transporter [Thermococcus sp.]